MPDGVRLRPVQDSDLPIFFQQQLDPAANHMAAFTAEDPADRNAFNAHWVKILGDEHITIKAVLFEETVVGHIESFERFDQPEVSYWLGKEYWSKGIATEALSAFLALLETRPLYARVTKDNIVSIKVLEKCGFVITGEDKGYANARGREVEEFILKLEATQHGHANQQE
jgi:RimJ/RimL family protein N-acetyltransferase